MFRNIRAGKYCPLFPDFSIAEQLGLFEDLRDILVNNNRYHISEASSVEYRMIKMVTSLNDFILKGKRAILILESLSY